MPIGGAVNGLLNFLRAALERFYVLRNREFLLPGVVLSVVVLGATLTLEPGLRSPLRGLTALLLFVWTMGVSLLIANGRGDSEHAYAEWPELEPERLGDPDHGMF